MGYGEFIYAWMVRAILEMNVLIILNTVQNLILVNKVEMVQLEEEIVKTAVSKNLCGGEKLLFHRQNFVI